MKNAVLDKILISSNLYNFFYNLYSNKILDTVICNASYLKLIKIKQKYISTYKPTLSITNIINYTGIKIFNIEYIDEVTCLVNFYIQFNIKKDVKINSKIFKSALLCNYSNKWLIFCIYDEPLIDNIDKSISKTLDLKISLDSYINSSIKKYEDLILNLYTLPKLQPNIIQTSSNLKKSSYDPNKTVNYAQKYALTYNKKYQSFDDNGGDCTNFVSQAIYHGGIPSSSTWKPYRNSWIRVNELYNYLIYNNLAHETNILSPGSIIQFFHPNRKTWTHSGIITYTLNNDCLYCCHSYDKLNYPLSYVYPDMYPKFRVLSIY